jgi:hypothetical protein
MLFLTASLLPGSSFSRNPQPREVTVVIFPLLSVSSNVRVVPIFGDFSEFAWGVFVPSFAAVSDGVVDWGVKEKNGS